MLRRPNTLSGEVHKVQAGSDTRLVEVRVSITELKRGNARPVCEGTQGDGYGMNEPTEEQSVPVPEEAKQTEEVRARWAWAEPSVWTDRMLTALEEGVKGGIWFSLIDKVHSQRSLLASYKKVAAKGGAGGVDHVTVEDFTRKLSHNLEKLTAQLRDGSYSRRYCQVLCSDDDQAAFFSCMIPSTNL